MISDKGIIHMVEAVVPLYMSMVLAYICLKWLKLKFFTPEQCAGINKFVAKVSIPLLSFNMISETNPYNLQNEHETHLLRLHSENNCSHNFSCHHQVQLQRWIEMDHYWLLTNYLA
ncbi:hypothetical protein SLE2022_279160 [Rubroshorea leprosula]